MVKDVFSVEDYCNIIISIGYETLPKSILFTVHCS